MHDAGIVQDGQLRCARLYDRSPAASDVERSETDGYPGGACDSSPAVPHCLDDLGQLARVVLQQKAKVDEEDAVAIDDEESPASDGSQVLPAS